MAVGEGILVHPSGVEHCLLQRMPTGLAAQGPQLRTMEKRVFHTKKVRVYTYRLTFFFSPMNSFGETLGVENEPGVLHWEH